MAARTQPCIAPGGRKQGHGAKPGLRPGNIVRDGLGIPAGISSRPDESNTPTRGISSMRSGPRSPLQRLVFLDQAGQPLRPRLRGHLFAWLAADDVDRPMIPGSSPRVIHIPSRKNRKIRPISNRPVKRDILSRLRAAYMPSRRTKPPLTSKCKTGELRCPKPKSPISRSSPCSS